MIGVTPCKLPSSCPVSTSFYIHWPWELEDAGQFVNICFQVAAFAEDELASDLSEGPSMDWQDWLSSRLHSWGMLSLVDEVLKVAVLGNLTELRELVLQAQILLCIQCSHVAMPPGNPSKSI